MSYDISLNEPGTDDAIYFDKPIVVRHADGREYEFCDANWGITYNYAPHYYRTMGSLGIRTIYGKTGEESIRILKNAINQLGNDSSNDYWESTEGNAKLALLTLLEFAEARPDGVWSGD